MSLCVGAHVGQKRVSDPLELEFIAVIQAKKAELQATYPVVRVHGAPRIRALRQYGGGVAVGERGSYCKSAFSVDM